MADYGTRPILPQGARSSTSGPSVREPPAPSRQRNYVFVSEHNRHRRLKVMRACKSCRARKIKCDAASTAKWPCEACQKNSSQCIPPSAEKDTGYDGSNETPQSSGFSEAQDPFSQFAQSMYQPQQPAFAPAPTFDNPFNASIPFENSNSVPPAATWNAYGTDPVQLQTPASTQFGSYSGEFHTPHWPQSQARDQSPSENSQITWNSDGADNDLSDALKDLKIQSDGIAPYIADEKKTLAEGPAVEEADIHLPSQSGANAAVGIPPEMMPSDHQAEQYFEYFFANIHPYVPVVNRAYFNKQWREDKFSISPLILEGIFACSARMLGQREEGARWLALAARHEESFRDVPRLSTIQGLLLVLKARETMPKRGYYYRSWTLVQYLVGMAKDLGLDAHNRLHVDGNSCGSRSFECAIQTRVWHTLFHVEMMVGGPQGRTEFGVDLDAVNTRSFQNIPGLDESEVRISQDQIQFVRIVKNIRTTSALFFSGKAKSGDTNFAADPGFVKHNHEYTQWEEELPQHLRITYNQDGSPPWIPFHFAANLQCYHLLSKLMHHRPQMNFSGDSDPEAARETMMICYSAATKICRLHEAILQHSGLSGLLCMLRGINLAIYTVLTCTMLHLAAITAPDSELNASAKDYFIRHMRILEDCSKSWALPAMQVQIDSLRQAFSKDLSKPFALRDNFPFGSPSINSAPTPPSDGGSPSYDDNTPSGRRSTWTGFDAAPLTPPKSTLTANEYIMGQNLAPADMSTSTMAPPQMDLRASWDPSVVFDRWNTAFNPQNLEPPSPGFPGFTSGGSGSVMPPTPSGTVFPPQTTADYGFSNYNNATAPMTQAYPPQYSQSQNYMTQAPISQTPQFSVPMQPVITPSMWQDTVAKSYGEGLKRRFNDGTGDSMGHAYKRMR